MLFISKKTHCEKTIFKGGCKMQWQHIINVALIVIVVIQHIRISRIEKER